MAGERVEMVVRERTRLGSAESRRLRRQGLVPGVLYGQGEPRAITVGERELRTALTGGGGVHAILDVTLEGEDTTHPSVLKDYQEDVVRGGITHIDLHEVRLDRPIQSTVALHLVGEAAGSKEGGVLMQAVTELSVEGLPLSIPPQIEVDVSELHVGEGVRIGDLVAPEGIAILDDPETTVASVTLPTRVEEAEAPPEGAEEAEGAPERQPPEPSGAEAAGEHQTVEG